MEAILILLEGLCELLVFVQEGTAPLAMKHLRKQRSPWPSPRTCQPVLLTSRTTDRRKVRGCVIPNAPQHPIITVRISKKNGDTNSDVIIPQTVKWK